MWIWLLVIAAVVAVDQVTKRVVVAVMDLHESIEVIPNILHWTYTRNRGAAMGMLEDHRWVFMVVSVVAIAALLVYLWKHYKEGAWVSVALSLIIGGGIGNMIDRVLYPEGVIDFIDFCAFDFWTYIFNVADAGVCVGAGILIVSCIVMIVKEARKKEKTPEVENEEVPQENVTAEESVESENSEETNEIQ